MFAIFHLVAFLLTLWILKRPDALELPLAMVGKPQWGVETSDVCGSKQQNITAMERVSLCPTS